MYMPKRVALLIKSFLYNIPLGSYYYLAHGGGLMERGTGTLTNMIAERGKTTDLLKF